MRVQQVQEAIRRIEMGTPLFGKGLPLRLRCNVYAIRIGSGVILFDCGTKESAPALHSALGGEPVSLIFLTHGHADHAGGGRYWIKTGAKVFAPEEECAMVRAGGPQVSFNIFRYPPFEPTGTIRPGCRIDVGTEFHF